MNKKDVIYIDVEDDITTIIGRLKDSDAKVIALVPPKRIGILQSAVNLRLLQRAAKQSDKHLALVTNNHALIGLAASAGIAVAKNLQTQPELIKPDESEKEDEDVIDGANLSIGEHASRMPLHSEDSSEEMVAALEDINSTQSLPKKNAEKRLLPKVPDFNAFRKKLVLGIGGGILLVAFLLWAIVVAPRATVVISAKTSSSSINQPVVIGIDKKTDFSKNTLKAAQQEITDDRTVNFTATGKKDVGSKATGTVEFSTNSISSLGTTIPAGTKLTSSGGTVFTTDEGATMTISNYSGASVGITAVENGSKYNNASGTVSGAPSGISASITNPTSGGVTKIVTIVTAEDVQKAKASLADEAPDSTKNDLKTKFSNDVTVIPESFNVGYKNVQVSPGVGQQADSSTLTVTVSYTMLGVEKAEMGTFLDAYMAKELKGTTDQRVYANGSEGVVLQEATLSKNDVKATLIATAQVGPKIDDNQVKESSRGKRYGEIQQDLQSIRGIDSVDVQFFPFWVNTVPNDLSRISVKFKLDAQN